jgi:hypothetical protein
MIGIPLVTVCYILTNISYLTVMSNTGLIDMKCTVKGIKNQGHISQVIA